MQGGLFALLFSALLAASLCSMQQGNHLSLTYKGITAWCVLPACLHRTGKESRTHPLTSSSDGSPGFAVQRECLDVCLCVLLSSHTACAQVTSRDLNTLSLSFSHTQAVFKRTTTYVPFLLVGSYFTNEVRGWVGWERGRERREGSSTRVHASISLTLCVCVL